MKRREKPYSLEEDMALDAHNNYRNRMPWYYQVLIQRIEEYDPGGKRAHAIAEEIVKRSD